ncbi:MAG TPA: hypothetical protein VG651_02765 [Stellaceae bacterium]|nr:hypothetical protein [Stellaceae bacterium]
MRADLHHRAATRDETVKAQAVEKADERTADAHRSALSTHGFGAVLLPRQMLDRFDQVAKQHKLGTLKLDKLVQAKILVGREVADALVDVGKFIGVVEQATKRVQQSHFSTFELRTVVVDTDNGGYPSLGLSVFNANLFCVQWNGFARPA